MKKPGIPDMQGVPQETARVLGPIRENIEVLLGRRGPKLPVLGPTATVADCVNQLERLRKLLQDDTA